MGLSLLVFDPNKTNRLILVLLLMRRGCTVKAVESLEDVIANLRRSSFAAVFVSLDQNRLSPQNTIAQIRLVHALQIPVIGIMGAPTKADLKWCSDLGFSAVISRPIDANSIIRVLTLLRDTGRPC
jgi:CheY-like chemotaxis protein